jgi:AAA15 family ATPase/GTPase
MYISNITLTNYRGVKEKREINLSRFSSIVGKNDAGKTIVLNAIASFLDVKFCIVTDFNVLDNPIELEFSFKSPDIAELLISKVKSKVKRLRVR